MYSHKDRMKEITFWAVPSRESPMRDSFEKRVAILKKNPKIKKEAEKNWAKAKALVSVQQVNGLGFPADKILREYNLEYNHRVLAGGLEDLPGSFNVAEAFQKFLPPSATFEIRPELDHLFSFDDFIDYLTSDNTDLTVDGIRDFTQDGIIYSYNSTSDPKNLAFSTRTGKSYGFASVSLVRFGNELSMILLAGRICDLEKESENIRLATKTMRAFAHRAHLQFAQERELRAEPLAEGSDLWKTAVLIRFDLQTKTMDVRYVYEDWGQSYHGLTDDRNSYVKRNGEFIDDKVKSTFEGAAIRLNEYDTIFELCKTCLLLPKYFGAREEDANIERHPTDFLEFRKKLSNNKIVSLVSPSHQISIRNVCVLAKSNRRHASKSEFYAPNYKVETTGFWKTLTPTAIGRDKNGNEIHGRTWVSQTVSWVEDLDSPSPVIAETRSMVNSENAGHIYVMRSAAHQKNIFKVGLTRRDASLRASELTRTTSSPDHFLVVQEWQVSDCVLAERIIHEELQSYRFNPNREFFMVDYQVIRSTIESVIDRMDSTGE